MRKKCPKTRKCAKVNPSDTASFLDWREDKRPVCKLCNHGKDKKSAKVN